MSYYLYEGSQHTISSNPCWYVFVVKVLLFILLLPEFVLRLKLGRIYSHSGCEGQYCETAYKKVEDEYSLRGCIIIWGH